MSRFRRRWVQGLILVLLVAACLAIWYLRPYPVEEAAMQAMQGGEGITVTDAGEWIILEGGQNYDPAIILYPGARVKSESYAPLARLLAGYGHRVFIARMPFQLAVTDFQRADQLIKNLPNQSFVIGGHSLGGAMASRYASLHPDRFEGVFFLGAYPDRKGDLRETELPVLSLLGSRDGIVNREHYEKGKTYLPEETVYMSIEGGNHAQFGSYGVQEGDHPAAITPQEQWQQTAAALEQWMLLSLLR
ncbi:alpha/beta fold hydrolase [Brevibacillus sp. AY1]|uniref:alpha/beta fold hydrolase n=1 Tax=Brevibacillus sp. AY1 TaxID=2807621 RepID=UPI0024560BC3|nr:alpha/beta fold hydrolase [Brevibacillus sp. AY1]MDH4620148.1 alpha/beta fold hydrolase [Brevibacillus sp. AY1]